MALLDPIVPYIQDINEFSDYPIVGRSISRGRIITAVQACPKVWTFKFTIATPVLVWDKYYDFLEDLRQVNTSSSFQFSWSTNAGLSYLTPYRGTLTLTEKTAVTVAASTGVSTNLNLANLPISRTQAFRKGDFIQAIGDPKPYTVISDVNSSATGTATLILNRPLFTYPSSGTKLYFGNQVTWTCFFSTLPTPSSIGQYLHGLQWSGSFEFTETA